MEQSSKARKMPRKGIGDITFLNAMIDDGSHDGGHDFSSREDCVE